MLKALSSLASGFLGNWQAYLGIFAAGLIAGSLAVWRVESWREQAHVAQAEKQTIKLIVHQGQISNDISIKFEGVKADDQRATDRRVSEIPEHVTPAADAACVVPFGFVRVWNDATHGPVPDAASGPDDGPSGVALSDVAKANTENAGEYDLISHQLTALQDWVRQQQGAANK